MDSSNPRSNNRLWRRHDSRRTTNSGCHELHLFVDCGNRYFNRRCRLGSWSRVSISRHARCGDYADVNFLNDVFINRASAPVCNDWMAAYGCSHQPRDKYFSPVTIGMGQSERPRIHELVKQLWRANRHSLFEHPDAYLRPAKPAKNR